MSFIKKTRTDSQCECQQQPEGGTFRLKVVPVSTDVRERDTHDESLQLVNAERIQDMFLPALEKAAAHPHGDGLHVHPAKAGRVGHIGQLHDVLDEHNLAVRIGLTPNGDGRAVAASLDRAHVAELLENKCVDVNVPLEGGTFRLHSSAAGRITAVEYVA